MNQVAVFSSAGLPAVSTLSTSLRKLDMNMGDVGVVILKMDKTGHWVFGADQDEVEDDSQWAINPFSFVHGFIAWGNAEVLGEKMVGVGIFTRSCRCRYPRRWGLAKERSGRRFRGRHGGNPGEEVKE